MKILFETPELAPWSKAGGLGDAAAALGKALGALGHEVRAVTPLYGSVPDRERMGVLIESLKVGVGGDPRKAACRVRSLTVSPKFEAWFIEHEDFYGAREVYPVPGRCRRTRRLLRARGARRLPHHQLDPRRHPLS